MNEQSTRTERPRRKTAKGAAQAAKSTLGELIGRPIEGVIGVQRSEDGWHVTVEVRENERTAKTTELLGEYDVELDHEGGLLSYRRNTRYLRGRRSVVEVFRPPGPR